MKKTVIALLSLSVLLSGCSLFGKKAPDTTPNGVQTETSGEQTSDTPQISPTVGEQPKQQTQASAEPFKGVPSAERKPNEAGNVEYIGAYIGTDADDFLIIIENGGGDIEQSKYKLAGGLDLSKQGIAEGTSVKYEYKTEADGTKTIVKIAKNAE
jgi:hypothetical protein